uniref:Uncharacterized protein n=1 Tax=mine drainage metagenome TaxID=410659 RepID=E6QDF0_9ZZZZ
MTNGIGRQKSIVDWLAVTRHAMHAVLNKIQRYDRFGKKVSALQNINDFLVAVRSRCHQLHLSLTIFTPWYGYYES